MRLRFLLALALLTTAVAQTPQRPPITGIAHITLYAQDPAASERFYTGVMGAKKVSGPATDRARCYFSSTEYVAILPLPSTHGISRMAGIAYATPDAQSMRAYLQSKGLMPGQMTTEADGTQSFSLNDPEGNRVEFDQSPPETPACYSDVSCHIIHAGFMVRDRAAEDAFYKNVLGFRPYWRGSMQGAEKADWISQQLPDAPVWLEYMMVGEGSDVPLEKVTQQYLGDLNHLSLGVPNMEAVITKLLKEHRLTLGGTMHWNGPQMGLDGKWQANIFDPDGTRIELMEFTPVMDPCCSPFTAGHPAP